LPKNSSHDILLSLNVSVLSLVSYWPLFSAELSCVPAAILSLTRSRSFIACSLKKPTMNAIAHTVSMEALARVNVVAPMPKLSTLKERINAILTPIAKPVVPSQIVKYLKKLNVPSSLKSQDFGYEVL
jgi:hypothetical protein